MMRVFGWTTSYGGAGALRTRLPMICVTIFDVMWLMPKDVTRRS
ncbi:unnamed protein product [Gemmata massiliana]|uniref:Uncharacterized protein n=1 Tax=Gemmata massiliana TaxID=1210884 RepID=A0A6P2D5T5_9BACT|nr:unnamed protein product [Gemmata massiliana]